MNFRLQMFEEGTKIMHSNSNTSRHIKKNIDTAIKTNDSYLLLMLSEYLSNKII